MELIQELCLIDTLNTSERLDEDFAWDEAIPLENQIEEVQRRLEAARQALGITNRLRDPASRKKHRSRVMSMMNRLAWSLIRLRDAIKGEFEATEQPREHEWTGEPRY